MADTPNYRGYDKFPPNQAESSIYVMDINIPSKDAFGGDLVKAARIRIDSKTMSFQVEDRVEGTVIVTGNPQGKYQVGTSRFAQNFYNSPGVADYLQRLEPTLKFQTKEVTRLNPNVPDTTKAELSDSPYYKNTPSGEAQNPSGPVSPQTELNKLEIKADKESKDFGVMRYPLKSENTKLDYIKFTIFNYIPSKFGGLDQGGRIGQFVKKEYKKNSDPDPRKTNVFGTIYLPIQTNINDNNSVGWGEDRMGLLEMAAANISLEITGGSALSVEQGANNIREQLGDVGDDVVKVMQAAAAGTLAKSSSNVVTRLTGAMLNPNVELLFNKVNLRQFTYTIKLTPRSPEEGAVVRKIIRCFKQNMAPRIAASNYFLKSPNVFNIEYVFNGNQKHIGLNKIKTSALQSCIVNYTPSNLYAPYVDGTMTSYELTLQFQELLPVYDEDYLTGDLANEEDKNISIGY